MDAEFYLFDCIDDQEVANALFDKVKAWSAVQPGRWTGLWASRGYGIQVEAEHRQMMYDEL